MPNEHTITKKEREIGRLSLIADLLEYMQRPRTHLEVVRWLAVEADKLKREPSNAH